ncbi:GPCR, PTH11-type [Hypomontagnella monticulosa]|nr:GPCR, PTH11-type [Hypomontagnella monticulosa]
MSSLVEAEFPPLTLGGRSVIATAVASLVLSSFWVTLRVWARRLRKTSPFMSEDILCYLALLSHLAATINYICMAVIGGVGYHITQLQPFHIERFSKTVFVSQVTYAFILGFIKLSIARNFQRIFFTREFRIVGYITIGISIAWTIQTILIGVLICQPVELNWDPHARGSCGNQNAAFTSVAAVDIVTDLMLLLLPLKPLMGLQMKTAQKIALALIFSGGFVTVIVTAIRLWLVFAIDFADLSYSVVSSTYLTIIQPGIAMMVACSPLLKPIMDLLGSTFRSQLGTSGNSSNQPRSSGTNSIFAAKRSRWRRPGVSLLTPSGFDRMSDSDQQLPIELGVLGTHEASVSSEAAPIPNFNPRVAGPLDERGIIVTSQTVVTTSAQDVGDRLEIHPDKRRQAT